ncbi:MAG: hypothetical protein KAS23_06310 [Anaerohalosphaera sp.]|nr:hypothetical protein [Anaerohalosphaera sp.]
MFKLKLFCLISLFVFSNSVDASLVALYPFDVDGADIAGGNDAVLVNGTHVTTTAGQFKVGTGAVSFDGIDDYATANGICAKVAGKDVTISMWIKAYSSAFNAFFASFNTAGGTGNRLLLGQEGSSSFLSVYDNGWRHSGAFVFNGSWHHIAFVLSDSTDEALL